MSKQAHRYRRVPMTRTAMRELITERELQRELNRTLNTTLRVVEVSR